MSGINYPITIAGIEWEDVHVYEEGIYYKKVGKFVAIRPCAKEYGGKTYLGIYLGEIAQSPKIVYYPENQKLICGFAMHNPAIYVFDLKKIIFGCESWWGMIESPEQLKQITNEDIDNVWYVKALKAMSS